VPAATANCGDRTMKSKRIALGMAIVIGLAAIAAPIGISIYLAWKQSLDEQLDLAAAIAADILRRTDETADQANAIFSDLKAAGAAEPCSEANISLMRLLTLSHERVKSVGYIRDNVLVCSIFGRRDIPMGPPAYTTTRGVDIWPRVQFDALPGTHLIVLADRSSGYSAVLNPALSIDVFVNAQDVSAGVFSLPSKTLFVGTGKARIEWIDRLGDAQEVQLVNEDRIVVLRRSAKYPHSYAAFAAIPKSAIDRGLRRTAQVLVPLGIVAGLVLALSVFYLARQQLSLPSVLKVALRRDEFFMHYLPIVNLGTGRWVGAEALIRWRRPNGEMVRPDTFIPAAEEAGLIDRITERVMSLVALDARDLFARHPGFHLSLNVSAADLKSRDILGGLGRLIGRTGARPGNLLVEVTERGIVQEESARAILGEMRLMGVQTVIDDFGTGYSSLSYLEALEIDYLKIDKSFVDTLGRDVATSQVVPHIIEMAKALGLKMIAEGVESEAQAQFLRQRGVQFAQGWLYARPMAFVELQSRLDADAGGPGDPPATGRGDS
jgi:sensor c-di-GMP phosphodiesterase-like protein